MADNPMDGIPPTETEDELRWERPPRASSNRVPDCERFDREHGYCIEGPDCTCEPDIGPEDVAGNRAAMYMEHLRLTLANGGTMVTAMKSWKEMHDAIPNRVPTTREKHAKWLADADAARNREAERLERIRTRRELAGWLRREADRLEADDA